MNTYDLKRLICRDCQLLRHCTLNLF